MVIPTSEQVGWLLEAVEEAYRPFIAVCAFAGLRIGEAAGLQVDDVDFLRRTLHVQRQAQNNGGVVEVSAPKAGSERVVSIPDELATLLAHHVERIGVLGMSNGSSREHHPRRPASGTGSVGQLQPAVSVG